MTRLERVFYFAARGLFEKGIKMKKALLAIVAFMVSLAEMAHAALFNHMGRSGLVLFAQVPTGSTFFVASAFGSAKTVTAVSNAAEAIVTATHDFANGDMVEITSGWGRLNKRAFRVKSVSGTASFTLEGADTTNTNFFPVGTGIGTVRKVSTFTQITTVMSPSSSGGDPKTVTYKFIESDVEYMLNDGFSATSYSMELDADSIGSAGYTALKSLTDVQTDTILKIVTRSGSIVLIPCTCALNESISFQDGQINKVKAAFNGNNRLTRYQS